MAVPVAVVCAAVVDQARGRRHAGVGVGLADAVGHRAALAGIVAAGVGERPGVGDVRPGVGVHRAREREIAARQRSAGDVRGRARRRGLRAAVVDQARGRRHAGVGVGLADAVGHRAALAGIVAAGVGERPGVGDVRPGVGVHRAREREIAARQASAGDVRGRARRRGLRAAVVDQARGRRHAGVGVGLADAVGHRAALAGIVAAGVGERPGVADVRPGVGVHRAREGEIAARQRSAGDVRGRARRRGLRAAVVDEARNRRHAGVGVGLADAVGHRAALAGIVAAGIGERPGVADVRPGVGVHRAREGEIAARQASAGDVRGRARRRGLRAAVVDEARGRRHAGVGVGLADAVGHRAALAGIVAAGVGERPGVGDVRPGVGVHRAREGEIAARQRSAGDVRGRARRRGLRAAVVDQSRGRRHAGVGVGLADAVGHRAALAGIVAAGVGERPGVGDVRPGVGVHRAREREIAARQASAGDVRGRARRRGLRAAVVDQSRGRRHAGVGVGLADAVGHRAALAGIVAAGVGERPGVGDVRPGVGVHRAREREIAARQRSAGDVRGRARRRGLHAAVVDQSRGRRHAGVGVGLADAVGHRAALAGIVAAGVGERPGVADVRPGVGVHRAREGEIAARQASAGDVRGRARRRGLRRAAVDQARDRRNAGVGVGLADAVGHRAALAGIVAAGVGERPGVGDVRPGVGVHRAREREIAARQASAGDVRGRARGRGLRAAVVDEARGRRHAGVGVGLADAVGHRAALAGIVAAGVGERPGVGDVRPGVGVHRAREGEIAARQASAGDVRGRARGRGLRCRCRRGPRSPSRWRGRWPGRCCRSPCRSGWHSCRWGRRTTRRRRRTSRRWCAPCP